MDDFSKIIGYEKEKEELRRTADMLKNSEKYLKRGVVIPNTLLLHGVPGTGKTVMAKAMIKESGLPCFSCKKVSPEGEFVESIRKTFKKAEENAPSIVFLDDMDKFAEDNLNLNSNKEEFAVIQTCIEDTKGKGVFVLATANDICYLPRSLMRSGRFGRKIEITTPDVKDTTLIINKYLSGLKYEKDISPSIIALILSGRSCATIECILNEARTLAVYDNSDEITKKHLVHGIMRVTQNLVERSTKNNELIRRVAYHEAAHAIVDYVNGFDVSIVSVLGYGEARGCCITHYDLPQYSFELVKKTSSAMLAGKAAIKLVFNEDDMGSSHDVKEAVETICGAMEKTCCDGFEFGYCLNEWDSKHAHNRIDRIVDRAYGIARECYEAAFNILKDNLALLDKIATRLIDNGFVLGNELAAIAEEAK